MNESIAAKRKIERDRCNEAAQRARGPLRVGFTNAANYWGAPIPKSCALTLDTVHATVPNASMRSEIKGVTFHVFKGKEEYLKREYEQFWVTSPAMTWAQMAKYCSVEELAALGSALMSRHRSRKVTTLNKLKKYLDTSPKFVGRNTCLAALPYIVENTDSPPETTLYGTLNDSGLGKPIPNYRINFGDNSYVIADMAYPDCKVVFEYQGAYHADPAQMRADMARINKLQTRGWVVILVTADDFRTSEARQHFLDMAKTIVNRQRHLVRSARLWDFPAANGS
ncbi:hypothetical protein [Bifidobacterium felsineum]|uniref:DUF559 domain-containing protein n=1 Tax=Bifidobacterium felsineum TaxID=2045440 RepID=A0A2M9HN21_9BIFI|nr:hypothetical protein [Bifidobacterium felsineum]MBT1163867.1 hypothetical protein [Bifidobacterium felsineum]PJM78206.1 hypothetical protein CSQ86_03495 [Bifidobacterium felsineum]